MVVKQFNARSQVALVFFLLLLLFNVTYSLQYKIPAPQNPAYFGAASIAFFTLLAVFGFSSLARAPKVGTPLEGLGALMCVIGFLVVTIYLNVPLSFARLAVVIGVMAGSAILVARLAGPLVALVLLLFVGMAPAIVNGLRTPWTSAPPTCSRSSRRRASTSRTASAPTEDLPAHRLKKELQRLVENGVEIEAIAQTAGGSQALAGRKFVITGTLRWDEMRSKT